MVQKLGRESVKNRIITDVRMKPILKDCSKPSGILIANFIYINCYTVDEIAFRFEKDCDEIGRDWIHVYGWYIQIGIIAIRIMIKSQKCLEE